MPNKTPEEAVQFDTLNFMKENIVYQMASKPRGNTGFFQFRKGSRTGYRNNKECNVYEMIPADGVESFKSYWCDYSDDSVHSVTCGREADLMFTAKMDGCSFGIGTPAPDGSVRVAHSNVQESREMKLVQDAMVAAFDRNNPNNSAMLALTARKNNVKQKEQLALLKYHGVGGPMTSSISPALYRDNIVTTFGVRDRTNGQWKFYFQCIARKGPNWEHVGCFPFPNQ